jgi:hypothetical protein
MAVSKTRNSDTGVSVPTLPAESLAGRTQAATRGLTLSPFAPVLSLIRPVPSRATKTDWTTVVDRGKDSCGVAGRLPADHTDSVVGLPLVAPMVSHTPLATDGIPLRPATANDFVTPAPSDIREKPGGR